MAEMTYQHLHIVFDYFCFIFTILLSCIWGRFAFVLFLSSHLFLVFVPITLYSLIVLQDWNMQALPLRTGEVTMPLSLVLYPVLQMIDSTGGIYANFHFVIT